MFVGQVVGGVGEAVGNRLNCRLSRGRWQHGEMTMALPTVKVERVGGLLAAAVVLPRLVDMRSVMLMRVVADMCRIRPGFVFAIARDRRPAQLKRHHH